MGASDYNRETYDRIWGQMSDFIRYNPGARHRRRHTFELLERCRFDSLLDVGCGNAELLQLVAQRWPGKRLAGADLSPVVVEENQRRLPDIEFFAANIEAQALPGGRVFDVVVASEVIEHLDHPDVAVRHLAAATAPGGHVVITCPTGKVWATEKHFGHVRHPREADLAMWTRRAGLDIVELWSWGFPMYAFTKWATNVNAEAALKMFAGEKRYTAPQRAISKAVWLANFVNLRSSPFGVQLFGLFRKPAS